MDKENGKGKSNYDIKLAEKYQKIRKRFIYKVANKDITFKQFCLMAQSEEYKTLRGIKISRILGNFSSWTDFSIQHAFIAYNIPINITVGQVMRNRNYFNIVSALMDSTSSNWQKRIKAPEGFPWNGNIVKALSELENVELPRELETAVRFYPDDKQQDDTDKYDEFKKESLSNNEIDNSNYQRDEVIEEDVEDDLDFLLSDNDEDEEESDDGLDSFLSNDDYEEKSEADTNNQEDTKKRSIQDELNDIMNNDDPNEDSFDKLFNEDDDDGYMNLF